MAINIQVWVLVEISKLYTDYTHIQFHDVYFFLTYLVWDIGSQELIAKYSEILWSPNKHLGVHDQPQWDYLYLKEPMSIIIPLNFTHLKSWWIFQTLPREILHKIFVFDTI